MELPPKTLQIEESITDTVQVLSAGILLNASQADVYQFYQFIPPKEVEHETIRFELKVIKGDPDVFVDQKVSKPSRLQHTWSAVSTESEEIVIEANDSKRSLGAFYVAGM